METIPVTTILDRAVRYLGNHPDHLGKRMALAHVLVDARAVRTIEAAVLLIKIWATPGAKEFPMQDLLDLANKKAKANG